MKIVFVMHRLDILSLFYKHFNSFIYILLGLNNFCKATQLSALCPDSEGSLALIQFSTSSLNNFLRSAWLLWCIFGSALPVVSSTSRWFYIWTLETTHHNQEELVLEILTPPVPVLLKLLPGNLHLLVFWGLKEDIFNPLMKASGKRKTFQYSEFCVMRTQGQWYHCRSSKGLAIHNNEWMSVWVHVRVCITAISSL